MKTFFAPLILALALFLALPIAPAVHAQAATNAGVGVASSAHPEATKAGAEILKAGGSAADAAMAMMLALTVVEPQSSGIGGGGFLLHHDARYNLIETIDGRETAPSNARANRFLDANGKALKFFAAAPGGKSVGIPGNMRLMEMAHKKWGKLPWATLFQPAIRLAEGGYAVTPPQYSWLKRLQKLWAKFPEAQALYWRDGKPARPGTIIKNPALGALLRDLSQKGADSFYSGETMAAIQAAVQNAPHNPSILPAQDFAAYKALQRPAVCSRYRGYKICGMGPPSSGATTVQQILGMLERFDLSAKGPNDPQSWHLIGEAMKLAYADRAKYLADRDFVPVPVSGLIDPGYLQKRSALISPKRARGTYLAGNPPGARPRTPALSSEVAGTTHFVAVDGTGNVASMTSTVEGPFGSQLIARGMVLNNELTDFTFAPERNGAPVANRVEPGKRPLSSMSPTIVYDSAGEPVLALGSAGGKRIIMHVAKTIIGVVDFGLPLEEAMALPNIFFKGSGLLIEKGSDLEKISGEISTFGHVVVTSGLPSKLAGAQKGSGGWTGAVDPRSIGLTTGNLP